MAGSSTVGSSKSLTPKWKVTMGGMVMPDMGQDQLAAIHASRKVSFEDNVKKELEEIKAVIH